MAGQLFHARRFLLSNGAVCESARSSRPFQGQSFPHRSGCKPHRASSGKRAANFCFRASAAPDGRAATTLAGRIFSRGPHSMNPVKMKRGNATRSCAWLTLAAVFCSSFYLQTLSGQSTSQPTKKQDPPIPVRFTDIRKSAGITFLQDSTQTEEKLYLETMGTGVAWLDYDQDGLMDLYFVQSGPTELYKPAHPLRSALYHNNGDGTFTDVTEKAGVGGEGHYGQGVAVGDYDNDGYPDLYVTGYQRAILYHNNGDGTFTDVTVKAGVADEGGWSTSAAWIDYDKDGYLDLVVANYIEWSPKNNLWCGEHRPGYRSYCHPGNYKGQKISLYHNNHDGTFTDATFSSGIGNKAILLSGVSMKFLDYDNDGWPDILQINGAMVDNVQLYHSEVTYKEPLLMFHNSGKGQFEKISDGALGPDFSRPIAGRGLATSDFDNDGDIDIATNNRGDYPSLLRNDGGNANHWLEVLLIGTKSNRDGVGSSLKLTSGDFVHVEQAKGGMSYMSANDPRIHFGLAKRAKIDSLEITWPSGQVDRLKDLPVDKIIAVKEGAGIVPHPFPKVPSK